MKNIRVLLLEGGMNEEHDISILTSNEIKKSLINLNINYKTIVVNPKTFEKDITYFDNQYLCFNALHGTFGEDGKIQKILDNLSFKYTHSNAISSYIGFNKELTKKIIEDTSICTPKHIVLNYENISEYNFLNTLNQIGPFVVKPISSGSSFGIFIFKEETDIKNFFNNIKNYLKLYNNHKYLLMEEFIEGKELTVEVIERDGKSFPIEVTEIISKNE